MKNFTNILKTTFKTMAIAGMVALLSSPAYAVTLKKNAVIDDNFLRLKHVFEGVTDNADFVLAPAPAPGSQTVLNAYSLNRIATAFGLNWTTQNSYEQAIIERTSTIIQNDDIEQAIHQKIKQQFGLGQFRVELTNALTTISLPSQFDADFELADLQYDNRRGRFSTKVQTADGQINTVTGRIVKVTEVPVVSESLRNGDVISARDIRWIKVDESQLDPTIIIDEEQLIGMTPRRMLNEMSLVRTNDVRAPIVVKKGDSVMMVLKRGKIQLTAKGRAMEHGAVGDTIRIMNRSSNRIIDVKVTGPQTAIVETLSTKTAMNDRL